MFSTKTLLSFIGRRRSVKERRMADCQRYIALPPFLALALPSKRKPFIMRKRFSLVFVLAWVAAVPATSWAQKGKIKIAVQGPLSGDQSAFGEHIKLGAQLAVEESVKA